MLFPEPLITNENWLPSLGHLLSQGVCWYEEKLWPKTKLGMKGFIWLIFPYCSSLLKAVRIRTQTGRDSGGWSWSGGHQGVILTGLLPIACSACFLMETRTTSPGMSSLTIGWPLPHWPLIEKCLTAAYHRGYCVSNDSSLCHVDTQNWPVHLPSTCWQERNQSLSQNIG